jgi:hypothetical protein
MLTNFCPSCPFDITVLDSNYNGFENKVQVSIENLSDTSLSLFMFSSFYRTDDGLEIDSTFWQSGLDDIYKNGGTVIKPNTSKRGAARFESALPTNGTWFMNIIAVDRKTQFVIEFRYLRANPLNFKAISVEEKKYEPPRAEVTSVAVHKSTDVSVREVTSLVERLELIEDKFSIGITGIYASVELIADKFFVVINFDITSNNGNSILENFYIHATIYNIDGQAIGMENTLIYKSDFLGFDSKSIKIYANQVPAKIRLFPKK